MNLSHPIIQIDILQSAPSRGLAKPRASTGAEGWESCQTRGRDVAQPERIHLLMTVATRDAPPEDFRQDIDASGQKIEG